jgi:hypothetical protein
MPILVFEMVEGNLTRALTDSSVGTLVTC